MTTDVRVISIDGLSTYPAFSLETNGLAHEGRQAQPTRPLSQPRDASADVRH